MTTPAGRSPRFQPSHWRRRRRRRVAVAAKRASLFGSSFMLMVLGVVTVPTPIPVGFVLFAVGLYFLARASRKARRSVKWMRRQSPAFSRSLNRFKHRLPRRMRAFVENSDPGV